MRGGPSRRVAVTGVGAVAGGGVGTDALWAAVTAPGDPPIVAAPVGFDPGDWMARRQARRAEPVMAYAVVAAAQALDQAGPHGVDRERSGCLMATAFGALTALDAGGSMLAREGNRAVSPLLAVTASPNVVAAVVAERFDLAGPVQAVAGACAGGVYAVLDAARLVAAGHADLMVAGGSEGPATDAVRAAYANLRVLSASGAERPFDERRDGFVFAEGAAALCLEPWDAAVARGATILAEVLGGANTNDAASMATPSGEGAERCIRLALADAGIGPADVAQVNAHGSATVANDSAESAALRAVFGVPGPPVTAVKGRLGHLMGAAGAVEATVVVASFAHRALPPVAADLHLDSAIGLDVVHGAVRPWEPGPTLTTSFGLGGQNGALVLGPAPG